MGIGDFYAVTLEEALVNGVDEGLLVVEIERVGGFCDGLMEVMQAAQKTR